MSIGTELLEQLYDRFNARDMEGLLAMMHARVTWANGLDGGHVHGRDGVRRYWTGQWSVVDPRIEPAAFADGADGETVVLVHQIVRDLKGNTLSDKTVTHVFRIADGLITRFDIR
jgi:hypothetical protein